MSHGICRIGGIHLVPHIASRQESRVILLRLHCNLCHRRNRLHRIRTHCGFSRKHYRRASVKHGIRHIRDFRTRRKRTFYHGLQHLCCGDYDFSALLAALDKSFLNPRKPCKIHFHSHIASCNHYTVGSLQNFLEIINSFYIFNFRNNFNITAAVFGQKFPQCNYIIGSSYKRRRDIIHILFDSEKQVFSVYRA